MPKEKKERTPQAKRIFQLRTELALDQVAFSELLHVDQGTVSKWENGKAVPGSHTYLELARLATPKSELQRELVVDGGYKEVSRRLREINEDRGQLPSATLHRGADAIPWDREVMVFAIETVDRELEKRGLTLPIDKRAQMIVLFYELCNETKSQNPELVERLLMIA